MPTGCAPIRTAIRAALGHRAGLMTLPLAALGYGALGLVSLTPAGSAGLVRHALRQSRCASC